jgi:predicted O-linked N-acetylglucosamine transferase (SPINDLY family)
MLDPAFARSVDELRAAFATRRAERRRWLADAQELLDHGELARASTAFREIIERAPAWPDGWTGLAAALAEAGQDAPALEAAARALEINPCSAAAIHLAGLIQRRHPAAVSPELAQALRQRVIERSQREMKASPLAARLHLGNLRVLEGAVAEAAEHFAEAYRSGIEPAQAAANMSVACALMGQRSRARAWRGLALRAEHDDAPAIELLAEADDGEDCLPIVALALGDCQERSRRYADALRTWQRAMARWPTESGFYARAAALLQALGRTSDAIRLVRRGVARCPESVELRLARALMLPAVYEREREIARWRRHYAAAIAGLARDVPSTPQEARRVLQAIGIRSNFYLPYQGMNDRDLQATYGRWVAAIAAQAFPDPACAVASPEAREPRRIRIGHVSAHAYQHTVARLFGGWMRYADRSRFHVALYHLGETIDALTGELRQACDLFRHLTGSPDATAAAIAGDGPDVLVYLDIGMHAPTTCVAAARLAPVQCAAWGHPTTTGLPTIDYFLSSEAMEPADADAWYTERLVRLPRIGVACSRIEPAPVPADRAALGLHADAVVYLCGQSPFKYLPQHDALLVEIARRVPGAQFLLAATHPAAARLVARLAHAFEQAGLHAGAIRLLPELGWSEFLGVAAASDVVLDTVDWSGGQTTLEVLSLARPLVTWPRGGMRGRHAAGMLEVLGVTETIARTSAEYVAIAVRLGAEPAWRAGIAHRIRAGHPRLFGDRDVVRALEQFYGDALARTGLRFS